MSAEKTRNSSILKTPNAILAYTTLFYGLVTVVFSLVISPAAAEELGLFLLGGKLSGIVGGILLALTLLQYLNYFGFDRNRTVGLCLGIATSIFFTFIHLNLSIFHPIEEFSIDARFRLSSLELQAKDVTKGVVLTTVNPKAHESIEIIGIDNPTVNEFQGWPFSWEKYAKILSAIHGSKVNTVMFDIFFQDESKNNYGLLNLVKKMGDRVLRTGDIGVSRDEIKKARAYLSSAMEEAGNVTVDYSFETSRINEETMDMKDYEQRLKYLRQFTINDIIPTSYDNWPDWVDHPEPPIPSIGKVLKGIGFANIRKQDTGVNRKLPLVIKWKNRFYPSIDLVLVCRYYGVDIGKDVQVKMGDFLKIRNIPDKKIRIGVGAERDIMDKPNPEREITIPIDEEGFMNINFIGGPWSFASQSFVDIASAGRGELGGDNDPFENKILLVAMYYATGVSKDIHAGPYGDMAGIEHHANALNTILRQDFLHYAPDWINYLILLIVGIGIGIVVPRYNILNALIFSGVFLLLFNIEVFVMFNAFNYIHFYFFPMILMIVTLIVIIGYKVLTEEANVKYIRSTFSRFVSKDIVNELLANPDSMKLGGDKKDITIFFSDIRGFTTISEGLTPENLVKLLNEYLATMTEIILSYRGTVDKYIGDAIMCFWGAPVPNDDHAYLGCLASLKQIRELERLQKVWLEQGWPLIDVGIGLNSGPAVVGNMGSSHRMDYTVMGDTINLGSRLEGTTKTYHVKCIISDRVFEQVKDRIIARELDLIKVKGKNEPVRIYELVGIVNDEDFERYRVQAI